ncbi:hypothetical protein NKDENANG_02737 [Candidatus Entotheonellaceae bacterium PAL068K]
MGEDFVHTLIEDTARFDHIGAGGIGDLDANPGLPREEILSSCGISWIAASMRSVISISTSCELASR